MKKNFYEIYDKYMSMTKEELAQLLTAKEMLEIEHNIDYEIISSPSTGEPFRFPNEPSTICRCKTWQDCTNPFRDCVNCPLSFGTGEYYTTSTTYTTNSNKNIDDSIINKIRKMAD